MLAVLALLYSAIMLDDVYDKHGLLYGMSMLALVYHIDGIMLAPARTIYCAKANFY